MVREQRFQGVFAPASNGGNKIRRNRASPARLVKLYKHLSADQRKRICSFGFGGLLQISCETIPAEFTNWLLVECFNFESSQLVFPGRGRIAVTAEAVHDIFELPNKGDEVKYDLDVDAINFMHKEYDVDKGSTPKINNIIQRLKENKEANDDFARSWLMIAVSTFLCPPTSLGINPRCYPSLVDLSSVNKVNWCQFVVNQLKVAASKINKKNSVRGCLLLLVILYVDSLLIPDVETPAMKPKIAGWTKKLLSEVIKSDTNHDGSFGKLKLKSTRHSAVQDSLFQMDDIHRFVASSTPSAMTNERKRKLSSAVSQVCFGFTQLIGSFLQQLTEAYQDQLPEAEPSNVQRQAKPKRARTSTYTEDPDYSGESDPSEESDWHEDIYTVSEDDASEYMDTDEDGGPLHVPGMDAAHTSSNQGLRERPDARNTNEVGAQVISYEEHDDEDYEPLISRLRRIRSNVCQASKEEASAGFPSNKAVLNPAPLEVVPPPVKKLGDAKARWARLHLPEATLAADIPHIGNSKLGQGCSLNRSKSSEDLLHERNIEPHITMTRSLDFTPPEINIMKFVEEEIGKGKLEEAAKPIATEGEAGFAMEQKQTGVTDHNPHDETGFAWSMDELSEGTLKKMEEDAYKEIESRKLKALAAESSELAQSVQKNLEVIEATRTTPQ